MIKPLRKRHFQAWATIAILLPVGIILSWLVIPNPVPVKLISSGVEPLPIVEASKESNQYCVSLRTTPDRSEWQLEWKNIQALAVPSALIYQLNDGSSELANSKMIGRIESRGEYRFPLEIKGNEIRMVLYDFIHEKNIDSINLKILRQ